MAPAPGSYRESHLSADMARSYDEVRWYLQIAKGLDWLVEKWLPADILLSGGSPVPCSVADFACGTGRVLEFLGRYLPAPVGIDVSPDSLTLTLARARCPRTVRQILGYSYLPYRRDGRNLWGPAARRTAEMIIAGGKILQSVAGSFLIVAALEPSGPDN